MIIKPEGVFLTQNDDNENPLKEIRHIDPYMENPDYATYEDALRASGRRNLSMDDTIIIDLNLDDE